MGKVFCPCGWVISDICCSHEHGDMISSIDQEKHGDDSTLESIYDCMHSYYRCSECGKIAVENDRGKLDWYERLKINEKRIRSNVWNK